MTRNNQPEPSKTVRVDASYSLEVNPTAVLTHYWNEDFAGPEALAAFISEQAKNEAGRHFHSHDLLASCDGYTPRNFLTVDIGKVTVVPEYWAEQHKIPLAEVHEHVKQSFRSVIEKDIRDSYGDEGAVVLNDEE